MSQEIKNVTLGAPGFFGLNTEDSLTSVDPSFASRADNCVIDRYGRIGARRGFNTVTAYGLAELGGERLDYVHYFEDQLGNNEVFGFANNKVLQMTTTDDPLDTITDVTPASYTITTDNWTTSNFNDKCYFFNKGLEPLYYDNATAAVTKLGTHVPKGGIGYAAFGRMWITDVTDEGSMLYWSDLLNPSNFSGGSSGSIDLTTVWPDGFDQVTGIATASDRLIIFGRNNILVYVGAESPATMEIDDTVSGVGCISHNSIQETGNDLVFLSTTGVRSLGRTITQNSLPIDDLSNNVRRDLLNLLLSEDATSIDSVYSPEFAFYLLILRNTGVTYCFDMRQTLEDGTRRVTRWPGSPFVTMQRDSADGTLYCGGLAGLGTYAGFLDDGESYDLAYFSPFLTFGDIARTKMIKKLRPTMIAGNALFATVLWGYGYGNSYTSEVIPLEQGSPAFYGEGEYGEDEYTGGITLTDRAVNANGNGTVVTVGVQVEIIGAPFSLQELNVQTLVGRLI